MHPRDGLSAQIAKQTLQRLREIWLQTRGPDFEELFILLAGRDAKRRVIISEEVLDDSVDAGEVGLQ